jgi:NADPH:quinone reductase
MGKLPNGKIAMLPKSMTAIGISQPGGPEMLKPESRPLPSLGPHEVLIEVRAAGVNRPDVLQRRGLYPPPKGASDIPGLEVAGDVVAIGTAVQRVSVGDKVCALLAGGGYAQYAAADAGSCLPIPKGWSYLQAAAIPETMFTVWSNLFERGFAADGDHVLVHGGSSGIGTTAIQLCKTFGVTIYVTAGTDEKCAACLKLGADAAINYKTKDFSAEILKLTGNKGVDVVLDMVGGAYVPRNLACMAEAGRHVSIAVQGGVSAEINLFDIMRKRLTLTGSTLRPRAPDFKAALAASLQELVWPALDEGRCLPVIDSVFPLEKAGDAHIRIDSGAHIGKIMLEVTT